MENVKEKLVYGIDENTDKRYLYVDKIIISNYKRPEQVEELMSLLGSKWSFYQYNDNGKKSKDCDYFFWQYVDDKGEKNWQSVDISIIQNSADYDYKMRRLIDYINNNIGGVYVDITIYYGDIRKLIAKIDYEIDFENSLKK